MKMKLNGVLMGFLAVAGCSSSNKVFSPVTPPAPIAAEKAQAFPDQPEFGVECAYGEQAFSIHFKSKSGEMKNNDMSVVAKIGDSEIPLGLTPGWYHGADSQSSFPSLCKGVPTYKIDDSQQVLMFFNLDQRPDFPETSIVLIDLKTKRVLSRTERIGKLNSLESPRYWVIPTQNGYQVRLIRDSKNQAEDWKWIIIKKGQVRTRWMTSGKKPKDF